MWLSKTDFSVCFLMRICMWDLISLASKWPVNSSIYYIQKLNKSLSIPLKVRKLLFGSILGFLWYFYILLIPQTMIEFLPYASIVLLFEIERPHHGATHSQTLSREITIILCYLQRYEVSIEGVHRMEPFLRVTHTLLLKACCFEFFFNSWC